MTDPSGLSRLGLTHWPFALVPPEGVDLVWADRDELRHRVSRVMRSLTRSSAPTLHLLWADFGAGKTHTLRFIAQEASAERFPGVVAIYSALPKGSRHFVDIYRTVIRAVGPARIADAYEAAAKKKESDALRAQWPDLWLAFKLVALGSDGQKAVAWNWLTATPGMSRQELAAVSLHGKVGSTDYAIQALTGITRLLSVAWAKRVLLMIDEFQRVETLRDRDRDEINAGLHSLYNAAQGGLSILLSFSFGVPENIKHFLNKELLDRADPVRLSIPNLSAEQATVFVHDIIAAASSNPSALFVSDSTIATVVEVVEGRSLLTPRTLLKVMGHLVNEALADLEDGVISEISSAYAKKIADDLPADFLADTEE
jgi:hypothetical protein